MPVVLELNSGLDDLPRLLREAHQVTLCETLKLRASDCIEQDGWTQWCIHSTFSPAFFTANVARRFALRAAQNSGVLSENVLRSFSARRA